MRVTEVKQEVWVCVIKKLEESVYISNRNYRRWEEEILWMYETSRRIEGRLEREMNCVENRNKSFHVCFLRFKYFRKSWNLEPSSSIAMRLCLRWVLLHPPLFMGLGPLWIRMFQCFFIRMHWILLRLNLIISYQLSFFYYIQFFIY